MYCDRIMARDGENADPIGHHNVLALASDPETGLLEGAHRLEVVYARNLRHQLGDLDLADHGTAQQFLPGGEVLVDGVLDVL